MKRSWDLASIFLLLILASCQNETPATGTPAPTIAAAPIQVDALSHITLLRSPAALEGAYIQLAGQYEPLPLPVCNSNPHDSPATWKLVAGELEVLAAGFDSQLRSLVNTTQPLVVEGRWQRWQGPVGCGRRVPVQEIWYLEVIRILSPNPLVAASQEVAQAPGGDGQLIQPTATSDLPLIGPPETEDRPPTATSIPAATSRPSPESTIVATATLDRGSTNTPVPTLPAETPTPIPTVTITGTATVTVTATVAPTITATPETGASGILEVDEVIVDELQAGGEDIWLLSAGAGEELTISVGPSLSLNVILELIGPDGATIATQNEAGPSQSETLNKIVVPTTGTYQVLVSAAGTTTGKYGLVFSDIESEPISIFQSTLLSPNGGSGSLPLNTEHLWGIQGKKGDTLSVSAEAGSDEDIIIFVIGPDGSYLDFVDDGGAGEIEELIDFELPVNGFYFIALGEVDFDTMSYVFTLILQS